MVQSQRPWLSDQDERRASSIQGCFRLTARSRGDALRARLNAVVGPQQAPTDTSIIGTIPISEIRMSSQLETVEAQALMLSAEERAQLADRLITSIFDDHEIESAWAAEVERRIDDIERGRAKLIPAAESIARARAAIK